MGNQAEEEGITREEFFDALKRVSRPIRDMEGRPPQGDIKCDAVGCNNPAVVFVDDDDERWGYCEQHKNIAQEQFPLATSEEAPEETASVDESQIPSRGRHSEKKKVLDALRADYIRALIGSLSTATSSELIPMMDRIERLLAEWFPSRR